MPAPDLEICAVFNTLFGGTYNVRMCGGVGEPLYTPARPSVPALLSYREDFASSALHEAAHWCLAGRRRRSLVDFGLFYVPCERRSAADQLQFEQAESRTQALEWLLSLAAGVPFHVSADQTGRDRGMLKSAVVRAMRERLAAGVPMRAQQLIQALGLHMGGRVSVERSDLAALGEGI